MYQASLIQLLHQSDFQVPSELTWRARATGQRLLRGRWSSWGATACRADRGHLRVPRTNGSSGRIVSSPVQAMGGGHVEQVAQARIKRHGPLLRWLEYKKEDPGTRRQEELPGQGYTAAPPAHDTHDIAPREGAQSGTCRYEFRHVLRCRRPWMSSAVEGHWGELARTIRSSASDNIVEDHHDAVPPQSPSHQTGTGDGGYGGHGEGQDSRMALRGSKRPHTVLELLGVEQHRKERASCLSSAHQAPGDLEHPGQVGTVCSTAGHPHRLQEHQGHGRQAKRSGAVLDQHWPETGSYGRGPCRPAKTIRLLLHEAGSMQTSTRQGTTTSIGEEDRGSVHGDGVLRLGRSSQSVEDMGRSSTGVPRSARLPDSEAHRLPVARLVNPDNVCYAKSALQAFYWGGVMTRHPTESSGLMQAGMRILAQQGAPYLPQCLHLQPLFRGWRNLHRQQDVAEFHKHVIEFSQAGVYVGAWESRLTNPHAVSDGGSLQCPAMLHFPGHSLTAMISAWHQQYAIRALRFHAGLLTLQLCRFVGTNKNRQPLTIAAGECLRLATFAEPQGTAVGILPGYLGYLS